MSRLFFKLLLLAAVLPSPTVAQNKEVRSQPPLSFEGKKLIYRPDSLGNRIPDFSYAGYRAGEEEIPVLFPKVFVPLKTGDATARIQAAIDYVSSLKPDANGFRGAVVLAPGEYDIQGSLKINTSGVVLRGAISSVNPTILKGSGTTRATLVVIGGKNDRKHEERVRVTDAYVPVNAQKLNLESAAFKVGDKIIIERPFTTDWIKTLGTDHFGGGITALGWKADRRAIRWYRTVTSVDGNEIRIDAPLTTALDSSFGGAIVYRYSWPGRISGSGIENIILQSAFDASNPKDEDHRWMAITIENAEDCWVRQVRFSGFAGSAVAVWETASRVTVEDCISENPVSEIGGWRRNTFFTAGQQTLFLRCLSVNGIHDFSTGACAAGPNVFVQCEGIESLGFSGGLECWASGVLMDVVNIDGNALSYKNRGQDGNGAGWTAANSVFWNCSASRIDCYQPPTAQNWAFGSWSQFSGDGYWNESNNTISPRSLYYQQLKERIGDQVTQRMHLLPMDSEASSSPTYEQAAALVRQARQPRLTLREWILRASERTPFPTVGKGIKTIDELQKTWNPTPGKLEPIVLKNGILQRNGKPVSGGRIQVQWWNGGLDEKSVAQARPHITRFVPGRTGTGYTDDLEAMTDSMVASGTLIVDHNYGLWYERRRDDHERVRRMDGDVWPPFYELPFARSGKGLAYDGLSKYDLTRFNKFYWSRLKEFADLADQKGLVLIHQHYFQHNILEAGAHYADFPWRTANNVNNTGFPEPVNYAGDKRIFMAEQFYDTTNLERKKLHRAYIRQCLSNFSTNTNVIHSISAEYTGPLHFVQFWLDVIAEWKRETGKTPLIALSVTKDVQDAILADPKRARVVDIIDIRYWYYQANGELYAPKGGANLAPRQHARLLKPRATSAEQVYRAVAEYRGRYPGKAVMYSADGYDRYGKAIAEAGGSFPSF